jgi:pimeloyl-ACP methyl ester carboxylesterase
MLFMAGLLVSSATAGVPGVADFHDVQSVRGVHNHLLRDEPRVFGSTAALYYKQALDHFGSNARRLTSSWPQRYFINDTVWTGPGSPIFVSVGGEGPVDYGPSGFSLMAALAEKHGAMMVSVEHRYYGKSRPTKKMDTPSLQLYLSSEQALADLGQFVPWLLKNKNSTASPVIAFGGSYPGCLAAWLRLKYPSVITGAVSSSAPLLAQLDFYQYNSVVQRSMTNLGSENCVSIVRTATKAFALQVADFGSAAAEKTRNMFNGCSRFTSDDDVKTFMGNIQNVFQSMVQYNPWPSPSSGSITAVCARGVQNFTAAKDAMVAMSDMVRARAGDGLSACIETSYNKTLKQLENTDFDTGTPTLRQWYFQLCNEFGQQTCQPQSGEKCGGADTPTDLFVGFKSSGLVFGLKLCKDLFGIIDTPPARWTGMQEGWSNQRYGAKQLGASNIVLVNGDTDPYSSVGLTSASAMQQALGIETHFVANASHCADMSRPRATDTPQMVKAKAGVVMAVGRWLTGHKSSSTHDHRAREL